MVSDTAHGHVRDSINEAGQHHDGADDTGGHTHDVRLELAEDHGRQNEGEVITEAAEQIAQLVPHAKGTNLILSSQRKSPSTKYPKNYNFVILLRAL